MKTPIKTVAVSLACAIALVAGGCSNGDNATDQSTAQEEAQEQQASEDVAALSATVNDAFIVKENNTISFFVVDATITNNANVPVDVVGPGDWDENGAVMDSEATVYCSWGDTYLPDHNELDPANPDYIESDISSILEPGDTMTKQFVYMLDYNNSLEFDQREDDYVYWGTPEDSFTFTVRTPVIPSDYSLDDGTYSVNASMVDTEIALKQTYAYDELELHGVGNPYRITSSTSAVDEAVDANQDKLVSFGLVVINESQEPVSFDDTFVVRAEQGGKELERVEDVDWSAFDDEPSDRLAYGTGDELREYAPGTAGSLEIGQGGRVDVHTVFRLSNTYEPVMLRVYLAADDSYPVYTYTYDTAEEFDA